MNYTENYRLPQWEETDRVLRADFNAAMETVDEEVGKLERFAGNCNIVMGEYVGTGTAGVQNPNQLAFPFQPKMVSIFRKDGMYASHQLIALYGQESICNFTCGSSDASNICSWTGNTLSWYARNNNPYTQMNGAEFSYQYVAIG